ncbi:MAG TPA: hypothetical protein VMV00_00755 [Candidatus Baltobacteraceae bacterium]|nr:hypothetical protein [Candidatus Baltobacteraceae bacterium]
MSEKGRARLPVIAGISRKGTTNSTIELAEGNLIAEMVIEKLASIGSSIALVALERTGIRSADIVKVYELVCQKDINSMAILLCKAVGNSEYSCEKLSVKDLKEIYDKKLPEYARADGKGNNLMKLLIIDSMQSKSKATAELTQNIAELVGNNKEAIAMAVRFVDIIGGERTAQMLKKSGLGGGDLTHLYKNVCKEDAEAMIITIHTALNMEGHDELKGLAPTPERYQNVYEKLPPSLKDSGPARESAIQSIRLLDNFGSYS